MEAFDNHLAKGEIDQAKEALNMSRNDLDPSVYWFNLGRVEAKLEHWADARISFLKSQKITSRAETQANLEVIESKLAVAQYEAPQNIQDYVVKSTFFIGSELALTLNLVLLVVGLWKYQKSKKIKDFVLILFLMLGLSGLTIWTKYWPWFVSTEETAIYQGPSEIFEQAGLIPKGIKILGKEKENWVQVIYPSRLEGWVKKESISEL